MAHQVTENASSVLTSAVRIVKGKVIVGPSGADNRSRGYFAAYHAETGVKLWSTDLGGGAVTPISYMLDGKQYVSVIARPVPNARLFTFVLDGTAPMPPAPPPAATKNGKGKQ